jgi:DNA-binding transcriptional LysR family regulator
MAKARGDRSVGAPDMSLVVILDALLEERSVTGAARRLGVTPSAVSHTLKRLREELGDPLLVRTARGMSPTLRAEELRAPIRRGLEMIGDAIQQGGRFDPRTARRSFTLATGDLLGLVLLPALWGRLAKAAPHVDLRITPVVRDVERTLESGAAEVVLTGGFAPMDAPMDNPALFRQTLFDERLVCVVREDHPQVRGPITLEQFCALSHALVAPRGGTGVVDRALQARGLSRRVAVRLPHFLLAPFLVATSDLVLTVGESVASAFTQRLPLRIVPPPIELPAVTYWQIWHERSQRDAGHVWLRAQIAKAHTVV